MMKKIRVESRKARYDIGLCFIVSLGVLACQSDQRSGSEYATIQSDIEMEKYLAHLSNWGRWGGEDQLGTLNYITPQAIREANRLIDVGETVTLARRVSIVNTPGIREASYRMDKDEYSCRDFVGAIWHGFAQTHLDALCHISADTLSLYNGFSNKEIANTGSKKLGVENMAERGIVGRGVLLDIANAKGSIVSPGTPIYIKDLEEAIAQQNITIKPGDILFVRTGAGTNNTREKRSGLHPECLLWVKEKQIALLGADGDNDVHPLANFDRWSAAFHAVGIPYMGLPLIDNCDLEKLSVTCARHKRWEFFISISPWKVEGATSSPINPIAIF